MRREDAGKKAGDKAIETLKRLLGGRADSWEIFFSMETGFGCEARGGGVEALKARSSAGVGVRAISGKRLGVGFGSVLSDDALRVLVDKTLAGGTEASQDDYLGFPMPRADAAPPVEGVFDEKIYAASEEEKIVLALAIEAGAMDYDPRIKRVRKASYGETLCSRRVVNSNGVDAAHSATYFSGSVTAVAEENAEPQMGWEIATSHERATIDFAAIGRGAAQRAVRMLGARKMETVRCPAIMENAVVTELLEALAGSFLADNVHKGKSMLEGKVGMRVASSAVTIVDDGVMPGGWASSAHDGEGAPKAVNVLLDKGVCAGYLFDTYWARRAGAASTGSSVRSSFRGLPSIGVSNLYIKAGDKGLDELLRGMSNGLYITEVLGAHTINAVSGDFSLGAAGIRVDAGRLAYPVRGIAISGNLLEFFSKAAECGSDLRFFGSIGAPSILIEEMEASGT